MKRSVRDLFPVKSEPSVSSSRTTATAEIYRSARRSFQRHP